MPEKDPNEGLAADAALAVEHTPERAAEQLAYMGGELDPDFDGPEDEDIDDGSVLPTDFVPAGDPNARKASDEEIIDDDPIADLTKDDADDADESADDTADVEGDPEEEPADDEESSAEETDDSEDEDEAEAEGDATEKPASKGIPKHRFDEVNNEKKALRQELADLRAEIKAGKPVVEDEPSYDIEAGEKEYMELMLDGDVEGALAKRREVNAAQKAEWKAEAQAETVTNIKTDSQNAELLSLSQEAQEMFDVFNPKHEDYNQSMLDQVMVYMRGYEASGETRPDAFVAALSDVAERYDLMLGEEEAADDPPPKKKPTGKKKTGGKKKADARDAAHKPVGDLGTGSAETGASTPDVEAMSEEEFDALPEATQARLRGDVI